MNESCKGCRFSDDAGYGLICREDSPIANLGNSNFAAFPVVSEDEWCGCFESMIRGTKLTGRAIDDVIHPAKQDTELEKIGEFFRRRGSVGFWTESESVIKAIEAGDAHRAECTRLEGVIKQLEADKAGLEKRLEANVADTVHFAGVLDQVRVYARSINTMSASGNEIKRVLGEMLAPLTSRGDS